MKALKLFIRCAAIASVLTLSIGSVTQAQTWLDLAHPEDPHVHGGDMAMAIPDLLNNVTQTVEVPVLVILLEFGDVDHQEVDDQGNDIHTPAFFQDFVFGTGGGLWTSHGPSLKQLIHQASNGRFDIVPATESKGVVNDGVAGWFRARCADGFPEYVCITGSEHDQPCDPADPTVCEDGGGFCAACDSWDFWRYHDLMKRTEAIQLANGYINYAQYDTMNNRWLPGPDGVVTDNELAVLLIHAQPNCQDHHGHDDWGTGNDSCSGGTVRATAPEVFRLDGIDVHLNPTAMPEANTVQVEFHEFSHQQFGQPDLYGGYAKCNPEVKFLDGTTCYPCTLDPDLPPEPACNDLCLDAICLDDGAYWGADYVAKGSTEHNMISGGTSCGTDDSRASWYKYTPVVSGPVVFGLVANFEATLAVYDGCGGSELPGGCVAGVNPLLAIDLEAQTTYWIRVAGQDRAGGRYSLELSGGWGACAHAHDSTWYPQPPGQLCAMDDASTAMPHLSPWANIHLGFTRPEVIWDDGTYTIYRAETVRGLAQQMSQPEALVIPDRYHGDPDREYFILENRAPEDMDGAGVIDEGLALWRISEVVYPGDTGLYPRRFIYLVRPQFWAPDSAALWDGSDDDYYNPSILGSGEEPRNTRWWDQTPSYIDIRNISAAGHAMTVDIRLPGLFVDAAAPPAGAGTPDNPLDTVLDAVDILEAMGRRWTVRMAPGSYEPSGLIIDTPCQLTTWGDGTAYIGQ